MTSLSTELDIHVHSQLPKPAKADPRTPLRVTRPISQSLHVHVCCHPVTEEATDPQSTDLKVSVT